MNVPDMGKVTWRKPGRSGANGNCVEVAQLADGIAVRDSKNPAGPVLVLTPVQWEAFIEGAKDGEFDVQ